MKIIEIEIGENQKSGMQLTTSYPFLNFKNSLEK